MDTKEMNKKSVKPFIIANPIYDTVFKRLMENQRISKFFLSTILEQQVEDIKVLPQEFTYRLDKTKMSKRSKKVEEKEGNIEYYSIFRLDFMATVRNSEGAPQKILIELQKSWDNMDVKRFRQYLGEQYIRVDQIDGKETILPITTIYILGNNLAKITSPCFKAGCSQYIDLVDNEPIEEKSDFVENLTHDCYVIQAGRIKDVRYTTNLDKLLSIFEQKHFIVEHSEVRKEYYYQPDEENIEFITDILYEMGADPQKRKEIEDEEEALRIFNLRHGEDKKKIEELTKSVEEDKKIIEEDKKIIEEKDKTIEEKDKTIEEKDKTIEEKDKTIEEKDKRIAELERLFRDK
ncbi:MAG: hypothetical protein LBS55_09880 [Prevotellaceae bacterium]|jgi:hypothetical protein|nr:hypothetical protein [Prevotellaceae bacterium]